MPPRTGMFIAILPVGGHTFTFAPLDDSDTVPGSGGLTVKGCDFEWNLEVPCRDV
jgi:hypothetical protein